jgi:hypothetical protein
MTVVVITLTGGGPSLTVGDGLGTVLVFARMLHNSSLNRRKPRVQTSFGDPQHVVWPMVMPLLPVEAKPLVETPGHFPEAST